MAKVRIQARSADSEDSANSQSHRRSKNIGALDILARVWKREGFVGWYQVITIRGNGITLFLTFIHRGCRRR